MTLELELAVRFLRRRAGVLLRGTSLAAFAGVALATAALVITLALMSGYSHAIAAALQRGNAHIVGFAGPANGPGNRGRRSPPGSPRSTVSGARPRSTTWPG